MKKYADKSIEELRLEANRKDNQNSNLYFDRNI